MTARAVILFARTPEAEAASKRLGRQTAPLFESLIAAWLRAARAADATPILCCDQDLSAIAPKVRRIHVRQLGTSFGERLSAAARDTSALGFGPILITGIDAPPPADLHSAFARLECGEVDAALAPARDGGVNIIGFAVPPLELLQSFRVRQRDIYARCKLHFARVHLFAASSDVDTFADIAAARRETLWSAYQPLLSACLRPRSTLTDVSCRIPECQAPSLLARAPPAA